MHIRSSWNSDRVATCCSKPAPASCLPHKARLIAQYRGREVSVLGPRGGKRHSWVMDHEISSAIVREGVLMVETVDGAVFTFDAEKGAILTSTVTGLFLPEIHVAHGLAA